METKDIIRNVYRKFKSFVFYAGSLEYVKPTIARFENDSGKMESIFESIANAIDNNDYKYFTDIINKSVSFRVLPKSFDTSEGEAETISNKNNENIIVNKINFFIDVPIELYILDAFWSCILAGATSFNTQLLKYSYGNSLSYNLFDNYSSSNILERINFDSLSFYDKYFERYKMWRNRAINKLSDNYLLHLNSTMLSLDLSRFYYSINVSFEKIESILSNNGSNYSDFAFVQTVIKQLYTKYAAILQKYDLTIEKNKCPIPIGLMSSGLVANILMSDFDKSIAETTSVSYYARYVDDILIIITNRIYNSLTELVADLFDGQIKKDGDDYYLSFDKTLRIQNKKVKTFKIYADGSKNIIDSLSKESFAVSEQRLFPDVSVEIENFKSGIYKDSDSIKVREKTGLVIDNKKLIYLLNSYLNSNKYNGGASKHDRKEVEKTLANAKELVRSLFNCRDLVLIFQKWNKIILFGYSAGSSRLYGTIAKDIREGIGLIKLNLEPHRYSSVRSLLNNLKGTLKILLEVAINQKRALVGEQSGFEFRKANLMDFYCICFPTINYYNIPNNLNLYKMSLEDLLGLSSLSLDLWKVKYSPKYIHVGAYLSTANLIHLVNYNKVANLSYIYNSYKENIAPVFGKFEERISIKETAINTNNSLIDITFKNDNNSLKFNDAFIGLANINIENHEIEKGEKLVDTFYCDKGHLIDLISLLNSCDLEYWEPIETNKNTKGRKKKKKLEFRKRNLDFLVFPEAYLEIEYLQYLEFYARKKNTTIIVGLKYIKLSGQAFNIQAVIIPFTDSFGHKSAFTLFREKNNYSPNEKYNLNNSGLTCCDSVPSIYYCFNNQNGIIFTAFICYELTDINARAAMQNRVDLLFASEFNADIRYFSSIIESTSRELYCYVAQSNSSNYGGTRIMAPFHSNYKIVASVSGGMRSFVHIDKVDIDLLRRYLSEFANCDAVRDYSKLKIDEFSKFKKPSANVKKR